MRKEDGGDMLRPGAIATLLVLRDMLQGGGQRIPIHELAYRRGISEKIVHTYIVQLEAAGLIAVNRSARCRPHLYTLIETDLTRRCGP
jgi:hypothetical protein